ncbi:hypothetical protein [Azospirillum sp.]|uniref:hypothetical protein n=1 Tax=Azospirillum sp. TaxID=34012 RepID=UPI003D73F6B9
MSDVTPKMQLHHDAIACLEKAIIHHRKAIKYKTPDPEKGKERDNNHAAHHAGIALAHTLRALEKSHEAEKIEADEYDRSQEK